MHEIDGAFRESRQRAEARGRVRRRRRIAVAVACLAGAVLAGAGGVLWFAGGVGRPVAEAPAPAGPDTPDTSAEPVFVPAIVELAGDPLVISIGQAGTGSTRLRLVERPEDLIEPGISPRLALLSEAMLSSSERLMTTLPSSPEDFAFFQAQSARGLPPPAEEVPVADGASSPGDDPQSEAQDGNGADLEIEEDEGFALAPVAGQNDGASGAGLPVEDVALSEESIPDDDPEIDGAPQLPDESGVPGGDAAAGWGETVDRGQARLPDFERTRIEDTTSVRFVSREADRSPTVEDVFVKVLADRTLDSILLEHRFGGEEAKNAGEALLSLLRREALKTGDVVALRGYRPDGIGPGRVVQVSVYSGETYVGTMARADDGAFVVGADPWVPDDLFAYSGGDRDEGPQRQYRLLDAIYSTAARNDVPSGVIGELIQLLTRAGQDLNAFAAPEDRLILLYSQDARDGDRNLGRLLYAAIRGSGRDFDCFVYRPRAGADFACMREGDQEQTVTVTNGMVTPVNGVMTSTFGPRKHPILKKVRIHKGVDWAAPLGTPVVAAFDGSVEFAGDNRGYGNFVRLSHSGGRASGYAHLQSFAGGIVKGASVTAGQTIGFVGTTGLSTGPHLHFELYARGEAIDPLATAVAAASDGGAVDTLVNRIIRVESAGNARAKNPLSSATGLGQFIESTWVRMMKTYRPDLARSLSRADLLALRFDPTISREMVANLARESEARLKASGHSITAGRLYLAHFLGVAGADRVLSAPSTARIQDVTDPGVVPANPFLTGMTAADVIDWAERKMRGKGGGRAPAPSVATRTVARTSPEFLRYKAAMEKLIAAEGAVL